MKNNTFLIIILIVASLLPSSTSAISTASTLVQQELSMEAYEKFLKNEMKISFDRFMPKYSSVGQEALYKKGSEYTLSELLDIVSPRKSIDYSYIDCGKDGINELVIRFNGMDIYYCDDPSTLVYIIKYIDEKLFLCYSYETWARSGTTMNEYGYYRSAGSCGATNHVGGYGLIDKDGNHQHIVSIESETDINGRLAKVANTKEISGKIVLRTIWFDTYENAASDEVGYRKHFFTFNVYDDNRELIEDEDLYTNSIYKEIFDEAYISFITPDELLNMISEKEEEVGATTEIKEGAKVTWKTLSGNMFSDYIGR